MSAEQNAVTSEEVQNFISKAPLYKKLRRPLPDFVNAFNPTVVFIHCPNCKVERPFRNQDTKGFSSPSRSSTRPAGPLPGGGGVYNRMPGIYELHFLCSGCARVEFYCWLDVNFEENSIRKVGQNIPWAIDISAELERDMAGDSELYKKALTLMSQSYGIGACAYLRRMVENQINPLLQLLYEMKRMDGAGAGELQQITDAIGSKNFTTKIDVASDVLPQSIMVAGDKPVKVIHDQLSASIHALGEDEAMEIAVKVRAALEYLIVELNRQQKSKKQYVESVRAIRGK